ncbi:MAG: rod shape-determining protein RodA [Bacteroidales bacterium]
MASRRINIWQSVDWITILLYLLMIFCGWVSIYAASYDFDNASIFDFAERSGKQLMWIGISVMAGLFIMIIDSSFYEKFAYFIYGGIILLLIVTIFIAPDVKGSRSWIVMGPISLQPAEFAKFATSLAVAKLMSSYQFNFYKPRNYLQVIALIGLPFVLILAQKETGSALVFSALMIMLFREGMSPLILISGICSIIVFVFTLKFNEVIIGVTPLAETLVFSLIVLLEAILLFWYKKDELSAKYVLGGLIILLAIPYLISTFFTPVNFMWFALAALILSTLYIGFISLKIRSREYPFILILGIGLTFFMYSVEYVFDNILEPHQQIRIQVSLGLADDPRGAGYNVNQSKIAIGSGGLLGKGFLNGTQTKLKYVPEQDTDFIFCTVGEEQGFAGGVGVIILFVALILRIFYKAEQQKQSFVRIYGYCVGSIFFFHLVINVGMVLGLVPVIGIPLPFFSYGGSSLLAFSILLFIFLRLELVRLEKF